MKLKSEFDNLVSKIKIPGQEVSFCAIFLCHPFFSLSHGEKENREWRRQAQTLKSFLRGQK